MFIEVRYCRDIFAFAWIVIFLSRPTSSGTIMLKSADPFEGPAIDPRFLFSGKQTKSLFLKTGLLLHRYLSTEHDMNVMVRGLKLMFRLAATRPLSGTIDETFTDGRLDQDRRWLNDEQLAEIVKDRIETLYHPCCTARMAPLAEGGVVDPYLRVHGVSNLRVVDASVFPTIISGHTVSDECLQMFKAKGPCSNVHMR
jgi:choline dehydrogenase